MAQPTDGQRRNDTPEAGDYQFELGRRRLLKGAGAGLLAAIGGVGTASAEGDAGGQGKLPVGGGAGYSGAVARGDADVVVRNATELDDALSSAASGDVVFLHGDASIDIGDRSFTVPAGVTLASDRGVGRSSGALLSTTDEAVTCIELEGDARVSGLRIKGPRPGADTGGDEYGNGVRTRGAGEVDNCVIWGFIHAGVSVSGGDGAHVHHNVISECNKFGYGYGVSAVAGHPTIEYNYFNYNRHSIASSGSHHGYTARYNHFGPDLTDTPIDVHDPGCVRVEIHNNVVEAVVPNKGRFEGDQHQSVQIRGTPDEVATIHDNWFYNPDPPRDSPTGWGDDEAIIQPLNDEWRNVEWANNHYGPKAATVGDVITGHGGRSSQ